MIDENVHGNKLAIVPGLESPESNAVPPPALIAPWLHIYVWTMDDGERQNS